ncbi:9405_t:CDS:1, partial [Gigaspora margarita]
CEKIIKLKRAHNESYFESHINGSSCKFQNRVVSILNFFLLNLKKDIQSIKQYPCTGLDNPIYKAYINRVFTHTTHGGAPRRDIVAQKLFPEKFPSNKAVKYKILTEEELQSLDNEIIRQSK